MVFITGDTHGKFGRIRELCRLIDTSIEQDTIIILGDSGFNYFTDNRSNIFKDRVSDIPLTFFCVHGNHEERAELIPSYKKETFWGGKVMVEKEFPHVKFAIDGEVYKIPTSNGIKEALVIGGAYSIDKYYRLSTGNNWYKSEQPSKKIKEKVERVLKSRGQEIDIILSHTCPYSYIPREWFISGVQQDTVDNSTEEWLDTILYKLNRIEKWYCGHYHGDKAIDKLEFMFNSIREL